MRWIFTPTFLACLGRAHGKEGGANDHEGARTAEVGARMVEGKVVTWTILDKRSTLCTNAQTKAAGSSVT